MEALLFKNYQGRDTNPRTLEAICIILSQATLTFKSCRHQHRVKKIREKVMTRLELIDNRL